MVVLDIIPIWEGTKTLTLHTVRVNAGFPSPAQDYTEPPLDLNQLLVQHPAATFFVRVDGDSMRDAGIFPGDILVVDKSLPAADGHIIIAVLEGNFTVKRFQTRDGCCRLLPDNPRYRPIEITPEMDFEVWGVVTYVLHKVQKSAIPLEKADR